MVYHRSTTYRKHWTRLVEYYGSLCYYCRKEMATSIDHVFPHSWDMDNTIENLVPACGLCNMIAGNKVFESVDHKRQYILNQRKKRKHNKVVCTDCLLPFAYREHSPSLFLCAECYDDEYGTTYSQTGAWHRWKASLRAAGISVHAHRRAKERMMELKEKGKVYKRSRKYHMLMLVEEYAEVIDKDEDFAMMLMESR